MLEKKEQSKKKKESGEFIPSYFGWISPEEQKKRAEELHKKTKWYLTNLGRMCYDINIIFNNGEEEEYISNY